jgi:SCY1-like protein 1
MVRDQANKTLEVFLQRVRKYAQTLPDTTQPPANANTNTTNPPRMGAAVGESSWTGWAISSFTNKLASVNGQMSTSGSQSTAEPRSNSVPPSTAALSRPPPSTSSMQSLPAQAVSSLKAPKQNPFTATSEQSLVETVDDFDTEATWDDGDNPWAGNEDDPFSPEGSKSDKGRPDSVQNSWTHDEDDPFSLKSSKSNTATSEATYDDKGEPDFAGWLSAQAQAKSAVKKSLPKGLTKSATTNLASRPKLGKANSAGNTVTKNVIPAAKPVVKQKETPKAAEEDEIEGWGDEWE